jgi:hypothetical protein
MGFFGSEAGQSAIGSGLNTVLGLGAGLVQSNQQKKLAEQQAKTAKALAEAQLKAKELEYQTAQLQLQTQKGSSVKSNTALYVGLGVGGVAILGLVVYLAVKK